MIPCERRNIPPVRPYADNNFRRHYPIQGAHWIWHPDKGPLNIAVLDFENSFRVETPVKTTLHVSADQRYELRLDGQLISRGPDRSDLFHWSFATYDLELPPGDHVLTARVWWISDHRPCAQVSWRGGFILRAEGALDKQLSTGQGPWSVSEVTGIGYGPSLKYAYHVVGSSFNFNGEQYFRPGPKVVPMAIQPPVPEHALYGVYAPGWRLYPSPLPEQMYVPRTLGRVRAIQVGHGNNPVTETATRAPVIPKWQRWFEGQGPLDVPAHVSLEVIIDLEDYLCAYPEITLSRGKGSTVTLEWAEGLYQPETASTPGMRDKGHRDEIIGKQFIGFGDRFQNDGEMGRCYRPLWWRSGRYVRLLVETSGEPLQLDRLVFFETRYPLKNESLFSSSDPALDTFVPLAVRGIEMCSHETYMDCPYYEQLMYTGDTRIEMLVQYAMTRDSRLTRRGIELFDWSRHLTDFVAERYPCDPNQLSLTYSLMWVMMLRDWAWWRGDRAWIQERLVGLRSMLEHFRLLEHDGTLLKALPGWSFVDKVPSWQAGYAPDGVYGVSSVVNLHYTLALEMAAELEEAWGDVLFANRYRETSQQVGEEIRKRFWNQERQLLSDTLDHRAYSEHAQCLAILSGVLRGEQARNAFESMLKADDLARTTVYFSFYLLETFYHFGRGDLLVQKLDFWKKLKEQGFKTPVESPEPSRSDCHAWGSHPLFHLQASLAGVRPAAPGFTQVRVAPCPGLLSEIKSRTPHPHGAIDVDLTFHDNQCCGSVTLPKDVGGTFVWAGRTVTLKAGEKTKVD